MDLRIEQGRADRPPWRRRQPTSLDEEQVRARPT